ncbi:MAG: TonB-dependent receptor [Candidatus Sulfotelmatobacter sp.]
MGPLISRRGASFVKSVAGIPEFRRTSIQLIQDNNFRGELGFEFLSSFLQGTPNSGGISLGDALRHTAENKHGLYTQDEFRWTPRLTVNYGMRWDYFGVVHEKNNLFYQMSAANGGTEVQIGRRPQQLVQLYLKPRLRTAQAWRKPGEVEGRLGCGQHCDSAGWAALQLQLRL